MLSRDIRRLNPFYFRCHSFNFGVECRQGRGAQDAGRWTQDEGTLKYWSSQLWLTGASGGAHPWARTYCTLPTGSPDCCRRTEVWNASLGGQSLTIPNVRSQWYAVGRGSRWGRVWLGSTWLFASSSIDKYYCKFRRVKFNLCSRILTEIINSD